MKKRILCFAMALCMVVLAIPFVALPVTAAAKEGFTSRFASSEPTWPTYEPGVEFKRFNGNWSIGYFDAGVYRDFTYMNADTSVLTTGRREEWTNTGVYLNMTRIILTDHYGFYQPADFKGEQVKNMNTKAIAYTYTAPYTGTVELDVTSVMGEDHGLEGDVERTLDVLFAIFINGEMVWPNKGDYYTKPEKWATLQTKEDFNELRDQISGGKITAEVTTHDKIQFAMALANCGTSYAYMQPFVTYEAGYSVVPEKVTQTFGPLDQDWPAVSVVGAGSASAKALTQTSELWTMGALDKANGSFTPYEQYTMLPNESAYAHSKSETQKPWTQSGGILLAYPSATLVGAMSKGSSETIRAAYSKVSIANGKLSLTLDDIELKNSTNEAMENASAKLIAYVNGVEKGSVKVETDGAGKVKGNPAVTVDVARGDVVVLAADEFDSKIAFVAGTPSATYSNIASFMNGVATSDNEIALEMVNVRVNGTIDLVLNAYATRNVYENASDVTLYLWKEGVSGEKTPANASVAIPMEMNTNLFSFEALYNGFSIKELADDMTVQVVAMNGDTVLCQTAQETLNIADVAYADYEAAEGKMKTLYANLLNYAAYAQLYFDHNTDKLANANLPADLKELDENMLYDAQFEAIKPSGSLQVSDSEIGSFSLILNNTVSIRAYIHVWETEKFDNKFYVQYGATLAGCYSDEIRPVDEAGEDKYSYIIPEIGAHQMSDLHYIRAVVGYRRQVLDGFREFKYYGYTMSYSVESYVSRMLDSTEPGLADLARAMMEFGKAAAAVY